jgi:hypothetical protein
MARLADNRDISPTLSAAEHWVNTCLINDGSILSEEASLWTEHLINEEHMAFVEHPDFGEEDFLTKLKGQMKVASAQAQQLMAELLWALFLFPSNVKPKRKRQQICEVWALSGQDLRESNSFLADEVLAGIGSGGPAFNAYRPNELTFLIGMTGDLKRRSVSERQQVLTNYDSFIDWIESVPQEGFRQFPHMLRYFAFPDNVERISSNNDRRKILEGFNVAPVRETKKWSNRKLDEALLNLRALLQKEYPTETIDFYAAFLKARWAPERKVRTVDGEVTVVVPHDNEEDESPINQPEARQSLQVQAKLAETGAIMGFKVWIPRADRGRIRELVSLEFHGAFLDDLPLNYDETTLDTIEQIDILWLKNRSIVRAFEVEHTTAVYSGLLRMADLLALQPNMDIRLNIVAPDERREKVFHEMLRPVFSLLDRGPLSASCTFISYDSVLAVRSLEHLSDTRDSVITHFEEKAET